MEVIYDLIFHMSYVFKYSMVDIENMTPFECEILYYKCIEYEQRKQQQEQS